MNIFIVRHAESDNNIHGKFCTFTDGDLTPKGIEQAKYCKSELSNIKFDKVYSSKLIRAVKTAQIVGQTNDIYKFDELSEINGGEYENRTWEEIDKVHKDFHIKLVNDLSNMKMPGGESFEDVKIRLNRFINNELKSGQFNKDSNILIVSHGITLRILITILLGNDDNKVNTLHWADNTAITHIELINDEEAKLHSLLSNEHLIKNGMDRSDYETWAGKEFVKGGLR